MTFVFLYTTSWVGCFGVFYGGITLVGLDGVALLQQLGADSIIDTSQFSKPLVNALIAAECNELLEFVRLPIVIGMTPTLSRRWRGGGGEAAPAADATEGKKPADDSAESRKVASKKE